MRKARALPAPLQLYIVGYREIALTMTSRLRSLIVDFSRLRLSSAKLFPKVGEATTAEAENFEIMRGQLIEQLWDHCESRQ